LNSTFLSFHLIHVKNNHQSNSELKHKIKQEYESKQKKTSFSNRQQHIQIIEIKQYHDLKLNCLIRTKNKEML
jgi:SepF-like predicted cell division protein (DUF552 family)